MAHSSSEFDKFLEEEVKKIQGIYVPVRAGLLRRMLIRKARCTQLHPNPEDEFCFPNIGPNEGIISRYGDEISTRLMQGEAKVFDEPIMVQKIRPDGYLILNGHHRWAAATMRKIPKVPIHIVDLTQIADLRSMYKKAKHDKRVALDLDEVVFCQEDQQEAAEKPLGFPFNRLYQEQVRLGIPALFLFFQNMGYDVWVYSRKLYSMDYIRNLFRHYHVQLTGIVTGTERKVSKAIRDRELLEKEFRKTYSVTIHADRKSLIRVDDRGRTFDEYEIGEGKTWSAEIMKIIREIAENEKKSERD